MISNAAKLMNSAQTSDDAMIAKADMAGEGAVIGEDDMAADRTVMGDMGIREKSSVTSDACGRTGGGATVNGDKFTEGIVIPDFQIGRLLLVLEILRALANGAEGVEFVPFSDVCGSRNRDMIVQAASVAQDHPGSDDAIGTNHR